ncbi:MAG: ATP-binding protein [Acidobacteria bacterium]|nr:ATP-binding protein [Acidobacteriota bacterium]
MKELIDLHGGKTWVESTLNQGATFRVELPIKLQPSEPPVEKVTTQ